IQAEPKAALVDRLDHALLHQAAEHRAIEVDEREDDRLPPRSQVAELHAVGLAVHEPGVGDPLAEALDHVDRRLLRRRHLCEEHQRENHFFCSFCSASTRSIARSMGMWMVPCLRSIQPQLDRRSMRSLRYACDDRVTSNGTWSTMPTSACPICAGIGSAPPTCRDFSRCPM